MRFFKFNQLNILLFLIFFTSCKSSLKRPQVSSRFNEFGVSEGNEEMYRNKDYPLGNKVTFTCDFWKKEVKLFLDKIKEKGINGFIGNLHNNTDIGGPLTRKTVRNQLIGIVDTAEPHCSSVEHADYKTSAGACHNENVYFFRRAGRMKTITICHRNINKLVASAPRKIHAHRRVLWQALLGLLPQYSRKLRVHPKYSNNAYNALKEWRKSELEEFFKSDHKISIDMQRVIDDNREKSKHMKTCDEWKAELRKSKDFFRSRLHPILDDDNHVLAKPFKETQSSFNQNYNDQIKGALLGFNLECAKTIASARIRCEGNDDDQMIYKKDLTNLIDKYWLCPNIINKKFRKKLNVDPERYGHLEFRCDLWVDLLHKIYFTQLGSSFIKMYKSDRVRKLRSTLTEVGQAQCKEYYKDYLGEDIPEIVQQQSPNVSETDELIMVYELGDDSKDGKEAIKNPNVDDCDEDYKFKRCGSGGVYGDENKYDIMDRRQDAKDACRKSGGKVIIPVVYKGDKCPVHEPCTDRVFCTVPFDFDNYTPDDLIMVYERGRDSDEGKEAIKEPNLDDCDEDYTFKNCGRGGIYGDRSKNGVLTRREKGEDACRDSGGQSIFPLVYKGRSCPIHAPCTERIFCTKPFDM